MDLYGRYGITALLPIILGNHEYSEACPLVDVIKARKAKTRKNKKQNKEKSAKRRQ
jgi:hypothetical protein